MNSIKGLSVRDKADYLIQVMEDKKNEGFYKADLDLIEEFMTAISTGNISYAELSLYNVGTTLEQFHKFTKTTPYFQSIFPSVDFALKQLKEYAYNSLFRKKRSVTYMEDSFNKGKESREKFVIATLNVLARIVTVGRYKQDTFERPA